YGTIPALDPDAKVIAKLPSTLPAQPRPEMRAPYAVAPDKLCYFDSDSGQRMSRAEAVAR
ncbi:MAG: hypothetical protein ACREQM_07580, partial [Candidatus Dormibacteraceae bacterium]